MEIFKKMTISYILQYLPNPEQLRKLQEYKDDYEHLAEAEQFALSLADINRLDIKHNNYTVKSVNKQVLTSFISI